MNIMLKNQIVSIKEGESLMELLSLSRFFYEKESWFFFLKFSGIKIFTDFSYDNKGRILKEKIPRSSIGFVNSRLQIYFR